MAVIGCLMSCRAECDWLLLSRDGSDWLFDELQG